jgi:ABC-type multidrug transport system ATPase subunit
VAEFVEYFALLKEMPPERVPTAVATAMERTGLGDKARAKLRTLSGGMLRRAGIAQAIVNEPELLLLDEPTAGLDPQQRVAFRALLRDLGQRATVVVSTHLVEDVGAACAQVALMDRGKILFCGTCQLGRALAGIVPYGIALSSKAVPQVGPGIYAGVVSTVLVLTFAANLGAARRAIQRSALEAVDVNV